MESFMEPIAFSRDLLRFLIQRHAPDKSLRELSIAMGCRGNYLSNLLNSEATDHPKGGPRLLPMANLADILGISVDAMVGKPTWHAEISDSAIEVSIAERMLKSTLDAQTKPGDAPGIHTLMFKHFKSGGDLRALEQYSEFYDLYKAPTAIDDEIFAVHVGKYSMAGITMGNTDPEVLSRALNYSSEQLQRKLQRDHLECLERGPVTTIESLDHKMENQPKHVKLDYVRLLAPVVSEDGEKFVLIYAVPLI